MQTQRNITSFRRPITASNWFWRWAIYSTPFGTQYSTVSIFCPSADNTLYQDNTVRNNLDVSKGSISTAQLYIFHIKMWLERWNAYRSTRTCKCTRLLTTGTAVTHSIGHTQVLWRSAATLSEVDSYHTVAKSIKDNKIV